ncbi:MAG: sensor histidine kinase KdpD, partial [Paenibacillus sp.]|nr:sensor histidine kinase KdpD [Paenibacillus sp.]
MWSSVRKQSIFHKRWTPYISLTFLIAVLAVVLHPLGPILDLVNIALLFLFPVLLGAVYWGIRPAFFAAVLSVLAFDFYFVPPVSSFSVADLRYLLSFGVYLVVAELTASLSARLKQQLHVAKQREAHTAALYELSRQISAITDIPSLLDNVSRQIAQTIGSEIVVYLPNGTKRLELVHRSAASSGWGEGDGEKTIAKWVYEHGEPAGKGSHTLREAPGFYVPLLSEDRVYGVLAVNINESDGEFSAEQRRLLEALAGLAASAIVRVELAEQAKIAHLTAESERLRTAILDSVSHELRTPLATIIG